MLIAIATGRTNKYGDNLVKTRKHGTVAVKSERELKRGDKLELQKNVNVLGRKYTTSDNKTARWGYDPKTGEKYPQYDGIEDGTEFVSFFEEEFDEELFDELTELDSKYGNADDEV
jgi:hypothetical protein